MTNKELFRIINKRLDEALLLPGILEYGLPAHEEQKLNGIEWDTIGIVNFGGSEGIYLDIYADDGKNKIKLGTYKTLDTDKNAFQALSTLNTEFVFDVMDYVWANEKEFSDGK